MEIGNSLLHVGNGQLGAGGLGAEGVWVLAVGDVLCLGSVVGQVRKESCRLGIVNACGNALLEVVY